MNLEEELNMINDMTTTNVTGETPVQPAVVQAPAQATGAFAQAYTQPMPQPTAPIQPAMVNPGASQNVVNGFSFAPLEFDITKQVINTNPIVRLTGQQGEIFRLHLLPNAKPQQVKVHWDQEKGHNFCCLAQAYNTPGGYDKCCGTHDKAKQRFVIPVVLIPSVRGQVQQGVQLRGELRALVVSGKTLQEIKDQAEMSGTTVDQSDIIATVKDSRYKTFNYATNPVTAISQIANLQDLEAEWQRNATTENVINLCGRLITREEYEGGYSNYDFNKYKTQYNQPATQPQAYAQQPYGYAQPMAQGYPQQPYSYPQAQAPAPEGDMFGSNPFAGF